MDPYSQMAANQALQQAWGAFQQAASYEAFGNAPAAAEWYQQAAGHISNSMGWATQGGFPVPGAVWFSLGAAQFNTGRAVAAMYGPLAGLPNFQQAAGSLEEARRLEPYAAPFHFASAVAWAVLGNLDAAEPPLRQAQALAPGDPSVQMLLAAVHEARGGPPAPAFPGANPGPGGPWAQPGAGAPFGSPAPGSPPAQGQPADLASNISKWLDVAQKGLKLFGDLSQQFGGY